MSLGFDAARKYAHTHTKKTCAHTHTHTHTHIYTEHTEKYAKMASPVIRTINP